MRVKVLFFGQLKDITGKVEEEVEVEEGGDLGGLFDRYAAAHPRMAAMRGSVMLARNRAFAARSERLADGDEVALLPPVSGGSGHPERNAPGGGDPDRTRRVDALQRGLVEIVRAPIDARALAARLLRGEDGAVLIFEGVARNHSGGRSTRYLEYEAYEPMALDEMRALARDVLGEYSIDRIAIVHRLGRLEIGETSVAIVVTAAHRGPAFDACRATIDRLKKTVPIWKKEYFSDGEVWVEGEWDRAIQSKVQSLGESKV